jgi:hypothetical protein
MVDQFGIKADRLVFMWVPAFVYDAVKPHNSTNVQPFGETL